MFWQGFSWEKATELWKFHLTIKNKKFRSNRLEFQPSFIVKLLFITVLQSRGACFREESKFRNLVICSFSVGLMSCQFTNETNHEISRDVFQNRGVCEQAFPFLPTPSPFHFFCSRSNFCAVTQLETLATQAIFWQSLCTWVIFLVISADDQFWTFNECDAMQNLPFHLQCKKKIPAARIHLLKRYLWHNLVHAIYQDTLGRISENSMRQMFIDMTYTYASKPAARYFNLPSFKHACLFYTKQSQRFAKALSFKSVLKISTDSIKGDLSTNALLFSYTLPYFWPPIASPNV